LGYKRGSAIISESGKLMQSYRQLLAYVARQKGFFALIFVATLAASALTTLQPWPLKLLADNVLDNKAAPRILDILFRLLHIEGTRLELLAILAIAGLLLFALSSALDVLLTWIWTIAGRRMVYQLADDLFARLQRRSLLFHTQHPVGDSMGRITGDCWAVHQVVDTLFFAPLHAALTMAGMIFLMSQLDLLLTAIAVGIAPLMVGASFLVGKPLRAAAKLKRDIEVRISAHVQQTLTGIPVVQAFAQEEREEERFRGYADAVIRAQQRSTLVGSLNSLSSGFVTTIGTGVILWFGAHRVINKQLEVGSIWVFLNYLGMLQAQMKVFANVYTGLLGLSASMQRITYVLNTPPEIAEKPSALLLPKCKGVVSIENVSFGYKPGVPVLQNVSLNADPGQIIALVGRTGAGKSTLVSLIPRLIDPWEGRVLLDGHDLRDVQLKSMRQQVSLVLQEPFLFALSIADNIAYGRPEATRAEIEAAAKAANAHNYITQLPEGYDTVLGERGVTLSGGERQRLSMARAILKDAPVLVLDEPTSALDSQTEKLLLDALERLMANRTTFLIAHRLSTVRKAHRIVVLDDGRIVETGTHDELLRRGDLYARLHELQFQKGGLPRI
jgi:ATP-binding cassette subfamily B protein/subfamily B ATP-binding cassette protein MsbA